MIFGNDSKYSRYGTNWKFANKEKIKFVHALHLFTILELKNILKLKKRFHNFFARNNLPREMNHESHVENLDDLLETGSQWIAWYRR